MLANHRRPGNPDDNAEAGCSTLKTELLPVTAHGQISQPCPGLPLALLGRWQRQALAEAVPSSAEREEIRRLRAELRRVEQERDMLKKVVTIFAQPPPS